MVMKMLGKKEDDLGGAGELGGYDLCTALVLRFHIRTRGYWFKSVRVESGNL